MSETIVMIHGMWGSDWVWENYKAFFENKGYICKTPILRFHDMDPKDMPDPQLGTTSLLDYADDLEKEIKELDAAPILMGHSMGGLLTQILASRGLAKAAVLLTPASPRGINALAWSTIVAFSSIMMTWGFWRKPNRISFKKAVYAIMNLMPPDDQRESYDKLVYESGRAAFEIGQWLLDLRQASKVDYDKVNCPVLVIAGKYDKITPAKVVEKCYNKYKDSDTYKVFEDNAHMVIMEPGWEEIAAYVSEWLNQNLDDS